MSDQNKFVDPLDELMNRHQEALNQNGSDDAVVPQENTSVVETAPAMTTADDDDEFGANDLAKEIEMEEQIAAETRQQRIEQMREAAAAEKTSVIMPPHPYDKEKQTADIDFQAANVELVTSMVQEVVRRHNLTSGSIPERTDQDPDLRMHVMGELMECYYKDGAVITPEFENIVLQNWQGYTDPNLREETPDVPVDEPQPDEEEAPPVVDPKSQPAQININVEKGNPVTVNVDKEVVAEMTNTNRVDIVVTEVSEQQLTMAKIVQNSQRDGIIKPFESDAGDVPLTLPLSAYRCVLKPVNYWEFIQLGSSPMSGNRADADKKQWSIIYDHIRNVSIGEFKDFEDFLKKTKYMDRELLMWGILIASAEDEETISIRCGNPKCKKSHQIRYNPRALIHVNDELVQKYHYTETHQVAPGDAAIAHYQKINSTIRRYKLPTTGYIVEIDDRPSAYDFINRRYQLMDDLRNRFKPTPDMIPEGVDPEAYIDDALNNNPEYSYLLAHALFITAISIVQGDTEYRYTTWEDIEKIITTALDMKDASILMQLVNKQASSNVSPMSFYLEDFNCDQCGKHEDRIPIPDIGNSLIFQLARRLSSTEINLIEMELT